MTRIAPPETIKDLDARQRESIAREGSRELARRSIPGTFAYSASCFFTILASTYGQEHPWVVLSVLALSLVSGVARLYLALRFDALYPQNPRRYRQLFVGGTLSATAIWGAFAGMTMGFYELSWTSLFVMLGRAGIAAGSTTVLSPNRYLHRISITFMIAPPLLTNLLRGGGQGYALSLMLAFYLGFLILEGKHLHEEYWRGLTRAPLPPPPPEELEAAPNPPATARLAQSEVLP